MYKFMQKYPELNAYTPPESDNIVVFGTFARFKRTKHSKLLFIVNKHSKNTLVKSK